MIIEAFLRWAETAKAESRARAANALGRAYLQSEMPREERAAAEMAMTYLLDDPSPRVRLALAEAVARAAGAPRNVILSLAGDQPEIAGQIILFSPVFTDADLVDLVLHGSDVTRVLIASRGQVPRAVCAALAEIGGEAEILCLLENDGALLSPASLKRIAERLGDCADIRGLLLSRDALSSDARHLLMRRISAALSESTLVQSFIGSGRLQQVTREATESATVAIAGTAQHEQLPDLVEHLRQGGWLTPAFLMHALCSGKVDFFACTITNLSGCDERRVRSIISRGRIHAIRALYESAGLTRDISTIFVEATLIWRDASRENGTAMLENVSSRLMRKFRLAEQPQAAATQLLDMVEKLANAERRQAARSFAALATLAAA
ncbi:MULTISPECIES: DUF2336 domain-containing protein [unclassified Rhizobium]|uniref:DUF2336 domain-containing protein n=1 Tax=unclassified Rhizobium TaxID=2613769 RepID=UPI000EA8858A|nr:MULTISPECIES: DUF2336 domain-containing protein [unclassified Rhizobium]AYG66310.1 DUF2336 domain-containing protein [Rhizobium sp. CCGE531]AYG72691.1 DUF2336 domain-containing protein [Rhizobium sp. CCGE532]